MRLSNRRLPGNVLILQEMLTLNSLITHWRMLFSQTKLRDEEVSLHPGTLIKLTKDGFVFGFHLASVVDTSTSLALHTAPTAYQSESYPLDSQTAAHSPQPPSPMSQASSHSSPYHRVHPVPHSPPPSPGNSATPPQ